MSDRKILLVRHPPVARAWAGRCYGRSDMGWSRAGQVLAREVVETLAAHRPVAILHSDLIRTRRLAQRIARRAAVPAIADIRWRERDFAAWEGRRWDAIWRETGDAMDGMLTDPHRYRPGGGETTAELVARACRAFEALPDTGTLVVVTHGGPIAAIRARLAGAPLARLADFIPACGEIVAIAGEAGFPIARESA